MRFLNTLAITLTLSTAAWALPTFPFTFQDALDSQVSSDVIGDPALFEIDYLRLAGVNGNTLQVDIRFNFGGGTSLSGFNIDGFSPTLKVGDLFFRTPANTYAYILKGHNGLVANGLYDITGTQDARSVLGDPSGSYRPDAPVWASPNGAQLLSTGSRSTAIVNNQPTNLLVSLYLPMTATMISDLNQGFDVYFASATCGNDEITGSVPPSGLPEPGTWALLGGGLIAAGFLRRKQ
jgi:hypothetical protein